MRKSILIELLGKLTLKETKEFSEYINSPFFNKNQGIIKLYDYLKTRYPDFEQSKVEKKFVFSKIFPNVKYNDGFMRTLIFGLSELAENYLSYTRYKNSYYRDKTFLLYELNDRRVDRLLEKNLKAVTKKLDSETVKDIEYYYDKYNIENEKYLFYFRTKPDMFEKIIKDTNLPGMVDYLSYYYITSTMGDYIRLFNLKNIYEFDFNTRHFDKFLEIVKDEKFSKVPCVIISYFELMMLVKNDDISFFYKIKELLDKYENMLDKDHVYNIYINLINFCNRMLPKGYPELQREVLEIYKRGLENKIFPFHGIAHFRFFTTVAETALKLKEFEWAHYFINNYKSLLPEEIRGNTCSYAMALYEFAAGNFSVSLELLSRVKYNDVYHKLKCKGLITMVYYELGYDDLLLGHLDTFNHFIINDKLLNKERKKIYSGFIRYVKKTDRIRQRKLAAEADELQRKIINDTAVFYRDWLIEKLEECKK